MTREMEMKKKEKRKMLCSLCLSLFTTIYIDGFELVRDQGNLTTLNNNEAK